MSVSFRDKDGTTRLDGELLASGGATGDVLTQQANGTYAPAAVPAPTLPHTHEVLGNSGTTIGDGVQAPVAWSLTFGPDTLLNIAVPTIPTIVTTGIYAFTVYLVGSAFTVGGYFQSQLEVDAAGEDNVAVLVSNLATAADDPVATLTITSYLTAGMQVKASVGNRDGVAARDFSLTALVQRLG